MANLIFNILIPILVLQKTTELLSPTQTLVVALAFPILYGAYDYLKNHHKNYISLLGILNVALTGGLALLGLQGIWFAIKEASFPFLIGLFVLGSAFTQTPLIQALFLNPQFFKIELIQSKIKDKDKEHEFIQHLKRSTVFLSLSFFFSSVLNFALALYFFQPISKTLSEEEHSKVLNTQIAEMTSWSYVVIMIPSMILLFFILRYVLKGLREFTGLTLDEILQNESSKSMGGGGGMSSSGK